MGDADSIEPGGAPRARRNVLVISTVARSSEALREVIGGEIDQLRVVVPVVHQS